MAQSLLLLLLTSCLTSKEEYLAYRWALLDQDGDGYAWDHFPESGGTDCDDFNAAVNPGAEEIPYNQRDDDCDPGTVDDDLDGDGYPVEVDCEDRDAGINPGASEVRGDGIDQDCDGVDPAALGDESTVVIAAGGYPAAGGPGQSAGDGGAGEGWTEETHYSGRVFDDTNLLDSDSELEIAIWRSEDAQGTPPFSVDPMMSTVRKWTGDGMGFTLDFDLDAGELATCEVYVLTEAAGYASSGSLLIESGDWVTEQEITLGSDAPSCREHSENQLEASICGFISDDTGRMIEGNYYHIGIFDVEEIGTDWTDLPQSPSIAGDFLEWNGKATEFQVGVILKETHDVQAYIWSEMGDGDTDADLWGHTNTFKWVYGTDIVNVDISFTEYIP